MFKYLGITAFLFLFISSITAQDMLLNYISAAKQNSPLINDNKNQSQINDLEVQRLRAFYIKPQIGVTVNYVFAPAISTDNNKITFQPNPEGPTNYFGYDLAAANGGTYQGLININQPLFNGYRFNTYANQTGINKQINENNIKISEHDIEKIITDQYILCLLDKKQMIFADSMMQLLDEQITIVRSFVESTILKQSDLTLLNIEYQNTLGLFTTYKATYKRDLMDLNILCGINDTTTVLIDNLELKSTNRTTTSNYTKRFSLDSLNLLATQRIFETKYNPQLSFFTNAGLNAVYAPTIPNRFGFSLGLSLAWNFFDGGQRSITRRKTDLQLQSVSFYKNNFLIQNDLRKYKILTELQSYDDRKIIAEKQLQDYTSLLSFYKSEILQGQLSILSYIAVIKNMTTTKRDYLVLETNRLLLINMYNYWNW